MVNLAIIPARGGSKRIPKKNIKDFLGKPIIAYSIEVALKSGLFDEVMVSTDSEEIAEIAKKYGANVPSLRSTDNSGDFANIPAVVEEVKSAYSQKNEFFSYICCLFPTSPFITVDLLKRSLEKLKISNADSIRPIVKFSFPIQRSFRLIGDRIEFMYPEYEAARSQDLEAAYHDAGMFYWMKSDTCFKGENRLGIEIPEDTCQDIDNDMDWKLAELKYQIMHK